MTTEPAAFAARWLESAAADAERRGLPALKPLLEGLAQSLAALRAADQELADERDAAHRHGSVGS